MDETTRDWIERIILVVGAAALTKGFPWFREWLKFSSADRKSIARMEEAGLRMVIAHDRERITTLEAELVRVREESVKCNDEWDGKFETFRKLYDDKLDQERQGHAKCLVEQAALRERMDWMARQIENNRKT